MSSVLRSLAVPKTNVTNVTIPYTLGYQDTPSTILPMPYTVTNGVLDIAVQDNTAQKLLTPGFYEGTQTVDTQASVMGGLAPVSSLGPGMITFLKNYIAWDNNISEYNLVTNIEIYNAPTMTKLRFNYIRTQSLYRINVIPAPVKTTPNPCSGHNLA